MQRSSGRCKRLTGYAYAGSRIYTTPWRCSRDPDYGLEDTIERAKWIGTEVKHPSFPVRFAWTGSFKGSPERYPLVLRGEDGLKPLIGFQQEVRSQMARAGFAVPRNYMPHIILLCADRCVDEYPIAPIGWTVRDYVLVMILAGMARHIHVARWQLH